MARYKHRNLTLSRWLIPLPAILFALTAQTVNAEPALGINTTYYTIDAIPPIQSTTEYLICGTEVENNINRNYDYELFEDCTYDLFMVHMTGFIDVPEHDTIEFMLATDDGGTMQIGDNSWGNWGDQGCTWMMSGELMLESGSHAFEVWMYEHGGNSCMMLAWNINNEGWVMVPDEVFTQQAVSTTTTTSVQETTTSWESSTTSTTTTTTSTTIAQTTTVPATTTTVIPSTTTTTTTEPVQTTTTTSTTTTSTTTTTTVPTTTTTTEPPYTPPQTSTTIPEEEETTTTVEETTTTTTEPQPVSTTTELATTTTEPETTTTEPETSTTVPDETLPESVEPVETTISETSVPDILDEILLDEKEQQTQPLQPKEDIPETTLLEVKSSSTTIVSFLENEPIDDEQFSAIIESIDEASPEQVVAIIETILAADITSEQATELVSNVAVLQAVTESEAKELFSEVVPAELSEEQAALIVEAVQSAPKEVRKAFEAVIDIFGSQFESYVPTGSNIPVSERRTLVAIGATLTMLPAPRVKR